MVMRLSRLLSSVCFGALVLGCSWQRFDEVSERAPVVLLERPSALNVGYGEVLAVASLGEQVRAMVGGVPLASPAATFELGFDERPGAQALSSNNCETSGERTCFLAAQPAGLAQVELRGGVQERCFAVGLGRDEAGTGLLMRCGAISFAQPVPDDVVAAIDEVFAGGAIPPDLYAAADRGDEPALLAASPSVGVSWFYAPLDNAPRDLTPTRAPGEGYGRAVAVARAAGGYLFAVGDPSRGEVWLYRWLGDAPEVLGCLGGAAGLGRALTAGPVDADGYDDLVVADDVSVRVLDGALLAAAPPDPDAPCDTAWLPAGAELARVECGQDLEASACAESGFGAALAVADLNGDDQGELIVSAPTMNARGKRRAGAVLVYELGSGGEAPLADTRLLSSSEDGTRFGAALAVVPQRGRDVLLVGAPGSDKAALVYCGSLFTGTSHRCR